MGVGTYRQLVAGITASISVMCLGIAMGWSSPILQKFATERPSPILPAPTEDQLSWMIAFMEFGNLFTPVITGILVDVIGRQKTLVLIGPLFALSWLIIYLSQTIYFLYVARVIQGLGCGVVYTAVPIYLGEISDPKVRGALSNLFQGFMYIGLLYAYVIGPFYSYSNFTLFCMAIPLVYSISVLFVPETPYFLLMQNKDTLARKMLRELRDSTDDINEEMRVMKESVEKEMEGAKNPDKNRKITNIKLFLISQFFGSCQIMTNMYAILTYSSMVFDKGGSHWLTPDQYTIFLGVVTLVSTVPSSFLVDKLGRKPLLVTSAVTCGVLELLAGVYFLLRERNAIQGDDYGWCVFVFVSGLSFCYSFGLGPIIPTIQCELFPTNARGLAFGLTILITSVTAFLNILQFQWFASSPKLGMSANFFFGCVMCLLVAEFTVAVMPETKGRTFAEIQLLFHKNEGVERVSVLEAGEGDGPGSRLNPEEREQDEGVGVGS